MNGGGRHEFLGPCEKLKTKLSGNMNIRKKKSIHTQAELPFLFVLDCDVVGVESKTYA